MEEGGGERERERDEKMKCEGEKKIWIKLQDPLHPTHHLNPSSLEFRFNRAPGVPHWAVTSRHGESCTLSDHENSPGRRLTTEKKPFEIDLQFCRRLFKDDSCLGFRHHVEE